MSHRLKVLAVDDEPFNLDIISSYLEDVGYDVLQAQDGQAALDTLDAHPDTDVIVLDRMMPRMDGMQFLAAQKQSERFRAIPVIMQTAAASSQNILEGIQAGVYYYLTKPYEETMLLSIVKSAILDSQKRKKQAEEITDRSRALGLMTDAHFRFRTLEEGQNIAYLVSTYFPDPTVAIYGLNELVVNAIEHGNLGISYAEKTTLLLRGELPAEIARRLDLPENTEKFATLHFTRTAQDIRVTITDQGAGFAWQDYMDISPTRATDPNGRGIATARAVSFSELRYHGTGNVVECITSWD